MLAKQWIIKSRLKNKRDKYVKTFSKKSIDRM